jgi:hypothetical protein
LIAADYYVEGSSGGEFNDPLSWNPLVCSDPCGVAQPISGSVGVSISGGGTYSTVNYYIDLSSFGSGTTSPGYAATLNTSGLTTGPHLILARLISGPDFYAELRLNVQVANPEVAANITVIGTSGTVDVDVTATSVYGIQSVTASIQGG